MIDQQISDQFLGIDQVQFGLGISFSEQAPFSDSGTMEAPDIARVSLQDSIQFQDFASYLLPTITIIGIGFNPSDSINLSDSCIISGGIVAQPSDTLGLIDSFTPKSGSTLILISVKDRLFLTDLIRISTQTPYRKAIDGLNFIDSIFTSAAYITGVTDTFAFSDSVSGVPSSVPSDSIALSDAAVYTLVNLIANTPIAVSDSFQYFDSLQFFITKLAGSLGDQILLQDSAVISIGSIGNSYLRRYLNDSI